MNLVETIKMPPREDAKEKQAFVGHKGGMQSLSAVSHHGQYMQELKLRFVRKVHTIITGILAEYKLEEIYIFAPKFVADRIIAGLDKSEQKKVRMQFYKECTKSNPMNLIEEFQQEIDKIQKEIIQKPGF